MIEFSFNSKKSFCLHSGCFFRKYNVVQITLDEVSAPPTRKIFKFLRIDSSFSLPESFNFAKAEVVSSLLARKLTRTLSISHQFLVSVLKGLIKLYFKIKGNSLETAVK